MVKNLVSAITVALLFSSCSTFKPLNFTSNRQVSTTPAPPAQQTRFINDISVRAQVAEEKIVVREEVKEPESTTKSFTMETPAERSVTELVNNRKSAAKVESASSVQFKYAVLMNTEVENLPSKGLLDAVDEWYGVRYRTGGTTKKGVDCSGFTVAVYSALYSYALPRVSREQYRVSRKISTTELQEGDLVFFNTNGSGVSHVGIYLGNNKFIHASVSRGVMVSGLFEPYYVKRYIGAGRIEGKQEMASAN
jgi:cell wall-associated NlpC family hydrolase